MLTRLYVAAGACSSKRRRRSRPRASKCRCSSAPGPARAAARRRRPGTRPPSRSPWQPPASASDEAPGVLYNVYAAPAAVGAGPGRRAPCDGATRTRAAERRRRSTATDLRAATARRPARSSASSSAASPTVGDGARSRASRRDPICVTPRDIFPPAAPKNLRRSDRRASINLIWDANTEADLAGYLVLRGEAPGDTLQPLTPAPITETRYQDRDRRARRHLCLRDRRRRSRDAANTERAVEPRAGNRAMKQSSSASSYQRARRATSSKRPTADRGGCSKASCSARYEAGDEVARDAHRAPRAGDAVEDGLHRAQLQGSRGGAGQAAAGRAADVHQAVDRGHRSGRHDPAARGRRPRRSRGGGRRRDRQARAPRQRGGRAATTSSASPASTTSPRASSSRRGRSTRARRVRHLRADRPVHRRRASTTTRWPASASKAGSTASAGRTRRPSS